MAETEGSVVLQARSCLSGEGMQVRDNRPLLVALGHAQLSYGPWPVTEQVGPRGWPSCLAFRLALRFTGHLQRPHGLARLGQASSWSGGLSAPSSCPPCALHGLCLLAALLTRSRASASGPSFHAPGRSRWFGLC